KLRILITKYLSNNSPRIITSSPASLPGATYILYLMQDNYAILFPTTIYYWNNNKEYQLEENI
ncbi:hypothetical protein X798_03665, partial [Onchocerca flexuosa]